MKKDQRNTVVNHNYSLRKYSENGYASFNEFYPYYLGEHCNRTNRRLHLIGTTFAVILFSTAVFTGYYLLLLLSLIQGYTFAWIGHFCFEKNKPATFKHPFYSVSDLKKLEILNWKINNFFKFSIQSSWEISGYGTKWSVVNDRFNYQASQWFAASQLLA